MLRLLNAVLCLVMLGVAAWQVRRGDAWWLWAAAFLLPAFWAFVAGFRHRAFRSVRWLGWLWGSIALWGVLLWRQWPATPGFWRQSVWLHDAQARDGMSLLLGAAVLLVALITAYRKR